MMHLSKTLPYLQSSQKKLPPIPCEPFLDLQSLLPPALPFPSHPGTYLISSNVLDLSLPCLTYEPFLSRTLLVPFWYPHQHDLQTFCGSEKLCKLLNNQWIQEKKLESIRAWYDQTKFCRWKEVDVQMLLNLQGGYLPDKSIIS